MAWTTPATGDYGQILTAAMYNATVRDNLLETAPAIASAAGNFFVADGPNKLAERTIHQSYIGAQQGTTSGSWTHLATVGPQVTVTSGAILLVGIMATVHTSGPTTPASMTFTVSGATTIPERGEHLVYWDGLPEDQNFTRSSWFIVDVNAGANTVTARYQSSGAQYLRRRMIVIPL